LAIDGTIDESGVTHHTSASQLKLTWLADEATGEKQDPLTEKAVPQGEAS
jgi:hypothetical protein